MKYKQLSIAGAAAAIALSILLITGCSNGTVKNAIANSNSVAATNSSINANQTSSASDINPDSALAGHEASSATESSSAFSRQVSYQHYANPRYGFSVDYPSDLAAKAPPDNGDGQAFASDDGYVEFIASGINNAESLKPAEYLKQIILPSLKNVTYQAQRSNWFIVSWTDGNTIGYEKVIVGNKSVNSFSIKYPVSRKAEFDPVIKHISDSFKTPGINDYH
jgi:hypothetical protein